jgi:hypothetical protein
MSATGPASPKRSKRLDSEANALRVFLQQVGSFTTELIYGVPDGKRLYHYTDLNGLHGIISKQDLWLTDSRYSNDSEEMRHGYSVARAVLEEQQRRAAQSGNQDHIAVLAKLAELLATPPAEAVYISCFCLEGNLLSQWRGYAANGTGVSMELEPSLFETITGPESPSKGLMRLWKVFYDAQTQTSIMTAAVQFGLNHPGSIEERAKYAAEGIFFFVPTFKHNDFHQEDECRLIFTPPPDCTVNPQFRVGRGMLTPYYSLHALTAGTFRLPIKRVVVGPSPHKEMNVASVRAMLAAYDYEHVPVEASATPFRA